MSVFSEGAQSAVILHLHPYFPSLAWDRQKKKKEEDTLSRLCGAGLCHLHLPGLNTAVFRKTKGGSLQGYHQTGAAWEEITSRRAKDETLVVTPLSLYPRQEVAGRIPNCSQISFVLKRSFFPLLHISFIHASSGDKSQLRIKACCSRVSYVTGCPSGMKLGA